MPFNDIRRTVETKFQTDWTYTPIAWEAVTYKPDGNEFVRLSIQWGESENAVLGSDNRQVRENGLITVQIFTEINKGTQRGLILAELARDVFQNWTDGGLNTYAGSINQIGETGDSASFVYAQVNVIIPFYYFNCS